MDLDTFPKNQGHLFKTGLLFGPTERAWATLRVASAAALQQDLPWPGGGGGGGALRYGRHAGGSGPAGGGYRPLVAGRVGRAGEPAARAVHARGVWCGPGEMASGAAARRALALWREWATSWWCPPRINFHHDGVIDHGSMIWSHDPPSRSHLSLLLAARAAQYDTMTELNFNFPRGSDLP